MNVESGCTCAKWYAPLRYKCEVTGDDCMYLVPDSKRCAEEYEEGPDAYDEESDI